MVINIFENLSEQDDLDKVVWRYLTFPKFISLITYQALWFPKLNILRDQFEGVLPLINEAIMHEENKNWKEIFSSPELHKQIDEMPDRNVRDGRELTVVNCWFLGDNESNKMWEEYVSNGEGVAIKSTINKLVSHVRCSPDLDSLIGRVKYVDLGSYAMGQHEEAQSIKRALLKDKKYEHEQEVRIVTLNFRVPGCVGMNGVPLTQEECEGINMNNFENPGLYISINLKKLLTSIVLAPKVPKWFELLVKMYSDGIHLTLAPVGRGCQVNTITVQYLD